MGFETAIWHFRSATSCFYWASKLLSGTFSAPLKTFKGLKTLKTLAAAFDGLSLLCHGSSRGPTSCFCWASKLLSGTSEAPQAVGLRNCYLARFQHPLKASKPSKQLSTALRCFAICYLARFQHPLKPSKASKPSQHAAFDGLSLLCHGTSRGPTSCFCWASKLLSNTSEAPQAVSIGLRNCYLARFQHPLKASKPSKPSQQLSTAFRHGTSRGPTGCFCWASKLLSGTSEAPQAVSIGLRNCYLARFQHPLKPSKASKPSKPPQQLSTAFRHGTSRGPTGCFCWASKLLSGTSEAPQAVSIGRNCYLARFQHPLKASQNPHNPRSSFRRPFAALPWALPKPHKLFLLGFETSIWHFRSATSCFYWASKLLSGTLSAPLKTFKTLPPAFDGLSLLCHGLPRPHELFLLDFETAIWHFRGATSCFYWASKLLSCTFSAPLKTLKGLKTLKTLAAAFDGLSLLCHETSRGPTSCFCWASKLLSGTSEAPQAVSIGLRNCYLARFQHPLKPSKASKPSQQLSTDFRCFAVGPPEAPRAVSVGLRNCYHWASKLLSGTFSAPLKTLNGLKTVKTLAAAFDGLSPLAMGPPEAPQAVSVGLRNCYLALPKRHKLFLLGFETAIWHVFSTP